MGRWYRLLVVVSLAAATMLAIGVGRGMAQPRAHVYLFRGLADVFSRGMDTLADELNKRGVYATSHSHTDWQSIAGRAAADYKDGKEGPIIIIGHSLGADAAMEMASYLGDKGVPVALVVPFDGTQSFPVPANVARVINFTQRDYAFMRPGPGFRGSLSNIDLRADPNIGHLNIDKLPALHSQVISAVLAIVGGHSAFPARTKPSLTHVPDPRELETERTAPAAGDGDSKTKQIVLPEQRPSDGGNSAGGTLSPAGEKTPLITAQPKEIDRPTKPVGQVSSPPTAPLEAPKPGNPAQIPD